MFSQITQKYLPVDKLKTKGHKVYADLHGIYCDKMEYIVTKTYLSLLIMGVCGALFCVAKAVWVW